MLWDDFSLSVSRPTLSRELRALGYRKLSTRPKHHAQDPEAIEAFKKEALPPRWTRSERPSRAARRTHLLTHNKQRRGAVLMRDRIDQPCKQRLNH